MKLCQLPGTSRVQRAEGAVTLVTGAGIDGELMEGVHTSGVGCIQFLHWGVVTIVRIPIGPRPDLCCTDGVFWMFLAKQLPDSLLLIIGMAPILASLRVAGSPAVRFGSCRVSVKICRW